MLTRSKSRRIAALTNKRMKRSAFECDHYVDPQYENELTVDIDFDGASIAWNTNKKRLGNGVYKYRFTNKNKRVDEKKNETDDYEEDDEEYHDSHSKMLERLPNKFTFCFTISTLISFAAFFGLAIMFANNDISFDTTFPFNT